MSQLILQSFPCFTYVTTHSPTLLLFHLCHSSFSNPSFASPTSQDFHLRHLASRPCNLCWWKLQEMMNVLLQAVSISRQVGATTYVETSAKTSTKAVKDAFEVAALAALGKLNKNHSVLQRQRAYTQQKSKLDLKAELKGRAKSCNLMWPDRGNNCPVMWDLCRQRLLWILSSSCYYLQMFEIFVSEIYRRVSLESPRFPLEGSNFYWKVWGTHFWKLFIYIQYIITCINKLAFMNYSCGRFYTISYWYSFIISWYYKIVRLD